MRAYGGYRALTCLIYAGVAFAIVSAKHPPVSADGSLLDVLIKARSIFFPAPENQASTVAVVALDQRSLDSPELADYPRVFLAPVWAKLLDELFKAGARQVGFDEIFAYNPDRLPGFNTAFNQPFLAALHKYQGKVVLARSQDHFPAMPFAVAAGFDSLALAEIPADPDGRFRHVPLINRTDQGQLPSLAGLLIRRAQGSVSLREEVLLAPRHHLESIPAYALVDVLRCGAATDALASAFAGKTVLVGGTLPEEDRKVSSDRFLRPALHDAAPIAPCGLRRLGASNPAARSVAGVFLHAAAVDTVLRDQRTATAPSSLVATIAAIAVVAVAASVLSLAPLLAFGAVTAIAGVVLIGSLIALQHDYWIPMALPLMGIAATPIIGYSVRYLLEERVRRRIEHAFDHYLSPAIVSRLASDPSSLKLGGEEREVSVMFADLSGFTVMSTKLSPEALTNMVNRYLGYVVDEVERSGGYVDKFIGDAVMAMWGAPLADPEHAANAVRAALAAADAVEGARSEDEARGEQGFSIKIGINSGPAIVGNVGTAKRYNYTAVGETVNLASRLEGVPPLYQCQIVVAARTAELASHAFLMRELDRVVLKGAKAPMAIYEPLVNREDARPEHIARAARFSEALSHYRAMRFIEASEIWNALAQIENTSGAGNGAHHATHPMKGAATAMAERAREYASQPPEVPWEAVRILTTK